MQKSKKVKSKLSSPTKHALHQMADAMPQLVWITDDDGKVIYYNKRLEGYSEHTGTFNSKWESFVHPDDLSNTIKVWKKSLKNGKSYSVEHRLRLKNGTYKWHLTRAHSEKNKKNKVIYWYGTSTIIDEQKKTQIALIESEMRYKQLVNGLSAAIFTCDLNGTILTYNKATSELWGREPIVGKDKWSGAYRIYKIDGSPLPHDQIPMAQTIKTGKAMRGEEMIIERPNGGRSFVQANPQPIFDPAGKLIGAVNLLVDITDSKLTQESASRLGAIVDSSYDAIIGKNRDGIVTSWNPAAEKLFGYTADEMIGKPTTRLLPPDRLEEEAKIIEKIKKGERVEHFNSTRIDKNGRLLHVSLSISPIRDNSGQIVGASKIARNITIQKKLNDALLENEKKFRNIIEQAPMGIVILQADDFEIEMVNNACAKIIYRNENDLVGKKLLDILPELSTQGIEELLTAIVYSGESFKAVEYKVDLLRNGKKDTAYFNFICHLLEENNRRKLIILVNEVTEEVKARQVLSESEKQFRSIVTKSPVAIAVVNVNDWVIERANETLLEGIWKKSINEVQNQKLLDVFPELKDQTFIASLQMVSIEGKGLKEEECVTYLNTTNGWMKYYIDYDYSPLVEADGRVMGIMVTMTDVTERVLARQKIEESEQRMNIAIESARLGIWELDIATNKVSYSKEYLKIFGYDGDVDLTRMQLMEHIHPEDKVHRISKLKEAYETGTLNFEMRIIDTHQAERWVRSIGRVFYDEKKKPVRMFGTVQDITAQKAIETELEARVKMRTEELQLANFKLENSNENLEQFAYVASHDLQEPLRKIRTYSSMLEPKLSEGDGQSLKVLQKITDSAERMSTLIYDLLNFSRLLKPESLFEPVDLNYILQSVLNDLELIIIQKHARINFDKLPIIEAIPLHMHQLFYNIINNALKFSREGVPPVVTLTCTKIDADKKNLNPSLPFYYEIICRDNGIGFDQQNADQIFEVFKRLHTRATFAGSGIGLALCRKIVLNHQGSIYAEAQEGKGASFHILLPSEQKSINSEETLLQVDVAKE